MMCAVPLRPALGPEEAKDYTVHDARISGPRREAAPFIVATASGQDRNAHSGLRCFAEYYAPYVCIARTDTAVRLRGVSSS